MPLLIKTKHLIRQLITFVNCHSCFRSCEHRSTFCEFLNETVIFDCATRSVYCVWSGVSCFKMSPTPKELSDDGVCQLQSFENLAVVPSDSVFRDEGSVRKRNVEGTSTRSETQNSEVSHQKKLELLYDGYYYDVTEFIKRHPGGNIIELYTDSGEDAMIPIQQFHYRSLKTVLARMKGLKKRLATDEESK